MSAEKLRPLRLNPLSGMSSVASVYFASKGRGEVTSKNCKPDCRVIKLQEPRSQRFESLPKFPPRFVFFGYLSWRFRSRLLYWRKRRHAGLEIRFSVNPALSLRRIETRVNHTPRIVISGRSRLLPRQGFKRWKLDE